MKHLFLILIILASVQPILSQQDSLKDKFPLTVGSKWRYNFNSGSSNSMPHFAYTDTGKVELEIISKTEKPDSIIWTFEQKRDFAQSFYGNSGPQYFRDTTTFDLIELKIGLHQLYLKKYDAYSVFPFHKNTVDSAKVFRYTSANTGPYTNQKYSFGDISYSPGGSDFLFLADTGMVRNITSGGGMFFGWWARFYLQEYHKVFPDAHLSIPTSSYLIKTMFGTPKDTIITFYNDGTHALVITRVYSGDQSFVVTDFDNMVQPLGYGHISLRFDPLTQDTIQTELTINSNSTESQTKIKLIGIPYLSAILKFGENITQSTINYVNFGYIFNGQIKKVPYSMTNPGNIVLKIDSIRFSSSNFSNQKKSISILPKQQTVTDTIYFAPRVSGYHNATMTFYSNTKSSPDVVYLDAQSFEEAKVDYNLSSVNFGNVKVGTFRDTTLTITNSGSESIYLYRYLSPANYISENSPIVFLDTIPETGTEIKPKTTYVEKIRFMPREEKFYGGAVIHEFAKPGYIVRTDTVRIIGVSLPDEFAVSQNYPNPFNNATKISFQIGHLANVSIKIFDMLGREVATVLNSIYKPGSYEVSFDGTRFASGVYFYRFAADNFIRTKKFVLLK